MKSLKKLWSNLKLKYLVIFGLIIAAIGAIYYIFRTFFAIDTKSVASLVKERIATKVEKEENLIKSHEKEIETINKAHEKKVESITESNGEGLKNEIEDLNL